MLRRNLAVVACLVASTLAACRSTGPAEVEAPHLEFRPEVGAVHRFRRAFDIRSEIAPGNSPEGKPKVEVMIRVSTELTCRVVERNPAGNTILEASVDGISFAMDAPGMKFEVDSRRPETWKNLPKGHPFGGGEKDLEAIRRTLLRFEVSPEGAAVSQQEFDVSADGRSRKRNQLGSLPGGGWPCGTLPCGSLVGEAGVGFRSEFAMTLPFGPPGGASVQDFRGRGSWTTAAWSPAGREATLSVEGEFPAASEAAPGRSLSADGTVSGEAVWSGALGIVRRSLTHWLVTMREPGSGGPEMKMTARFEEELLE